MPLERIVIAVETPFCRRDHDRFGVEVFRRAGVPVEVWDMTPLFRPKVDATVKPWDALDPDQGQGRGQGQDPNPGQGLVKVRTRGQALGLVRSLGPKGLVISHCSLSGKSLFFFRELGNGKTPWTYVTSGSIPALPRSRAFMLETVKKLASPGKVLDKLVSLWGIRGLGVPACGYHLAAGGENIADECPMGGPETRTIRAHSFDYDIFLKLRGQECVGDTAVFLDEYMPFHPDYVHQGIEPFSTAGEYYPQLCRIFARIEEKTGLKVVVAAHPRADYASHDRDYFEGRPVISGKSAELVRDCRMVILHASTAVGFAALFEKPMVFVTTDSLDASRMGPFIKTMATGFGQKPLNADQEDYVLERAPDVDVQACRQYVHRYIKTPGTPDIPCWEIFLNNIQLKPPVEEKAC